MKAIKFAVHPANPKVEIVILDTDGVDKEVGEISPMFGGGYALTSETGAVFPFPTRWEAVRAVACANSWVVKRSEAEKLWG